MANELASLANADRAPIGSGMAARSRNTISMRNMYSKYVEEAAMNGEEPMPYDQWVQTQEG